MSVAGVFEDTSTGRNLRQRHGLLAALNMVRKERDVKALLVHKVDRFARNVYEHMLLKNELKAMNVKLISVVEHFDSSPMGDLIEHIMAAQAEFYSANLAFEVKKGMEERLRRGRWNGPPPIGYVLKNKTLVLDPARAPLIKRGFELWSEGTMTAEQMAEAVHREGLVSRHGRFIPKGKWCAILQNPFYVGTMKTRSGSYPGLHAPLVSRELFDQCQAVFARKRQRRGGVTRKHLFLLSGLVACPTCTRHICGEVHEKKTGRKYTYYRCQMPGCTYCLPAGKLDTDVLAALMSLNLPGKTSKVLRQKAREDERLRAEQHALRVRELRRERTRLEETWLELTRRLVDRKIRSEDFEREQDVVRQARRATEWMLATKRQVVGEDHADKLRLMRGLHATLTSGSLVEKRQLIVELIQEVSVVGERPTITLKPGWRNLVNPGGVQGHDMVADQVA